MRGKKIVFVVVGLLVLVCCGVFLKTQDTSAMTVSECINGAGNLYNQISSVREVCDNAASVANYCAIWIAGDNKEWAPILYTDSPSGKLTVYYAGSCSRGPAYAANVHVTNLYSIAPASQSFRRGVLAGYSDYPAYSWWKEKVGYWPTELDVAVFITGVQPTRVNVNGVLYDSYTQTARIWRCHGGEDGVADLGSCGPQDEQLTVRVKVPTILKFNFSAWAVDTSGKYLKSEKICNSTVNQGGSVSCSAPSISGYSFKGWRSNRTSGGTSGSNPYSVSNMTSNVEVYAVYERNSFTGMASVAASKNWNGTSNRGTTNWLNTDGSTSITVDCANSGCEVGLWLKLKRDAGTGSTAYARWIKKNGADSDWSSSSTNFRTNPAFIVGANDSAGESVILKPGESYCRYLRFYPFGPYSDGTTKTLSACANAKKTKFEGKSSVAGAASSAVGFTNATGSKMVPIACNQNGCKVSFEHRLRSDGSIGTTDYTVTRSSNLTSGIYSIANRTESNPLAKGSAFKGGEARVFKSEELTLYPGMKVCEALKFKTSNGSDSSYATTMVCVYAEGDAQPPDPGNPDTPEPPNSDPTQPSGDASFINIKVRNNDVNKYSYYQRTVYARPDNTVTFRATYNPRLQYTYNIVTDKVIINNSGLIPSGNTMNTLTLGVRLNLSVGNYGLLKGWNNAFAVNSNSGFFSKSYGPYGNGNINKRAESNGYKVKKTDVGKSLEETAKTNTADANNANRTTPSQVKFTGQNISGAYRTVGQVKTDSKEKTAYVKVPYNYRTNIDVTVPEDNVVPAGEETKATINIDVLPKSNKETTNGGDDEAYATIVPDHKIKIVVYVPGSGTTKNGDTNYAGADLCVRYNGASECGEKLVPIEDNSTLNKKGNLEGEKGIKETESFIIPDMDAGNEVCVAAAIYPSTSGADTNMDKDGSKTWNVSNSKCYKVSKKPSVQVWGGGIYSNGSLSTPTSKKHNVAGYENYSADAWNRYFMFGSFAENDVVSNGVVEGFASGASMGYARNDNGNLWPSYNSDNTENIPLLGLYGPGGSRENGDNFCVRSVLTFANDNCSNGKAGSLGGDTRSAESNNLGGDTRSAESNNKSELLARFENSKEGEGVEYTKIEGDNTISENIVVANGTTKVLDYSADVTIASSLIVMDADGAGYNTLEDIPKLIIHAKNIWINCEVDRIDAVLIADEDTNTCYNSSDINSQQNSRQLIINGSVITNTLTANRTYGAAKGANSVIPAEIIDYDATLYLWAANNANMTNSGKMTTAYTHELSPRY